MKVLIGLNERKMPVEVGSTIDTEVIGNCVEEMSRGLAGVLRKDGSYCVDGVDDGFRITDMGTGWKLTYLYDASEDRLVVRSCERGKGRSKFSDKNVKDKIGACILDFLIELTDSGVVVDAVTFDMPYHSSDVRVYVSAKENLIEMGL